jgi:signal peptidase I
MSILRKIYSFLIDTLQSLLIAAAVFLVVYQFILRPFEVKGDSMVPNFENNEYVLTNILGLHFKRPELGDVVVFKAPPDPKKAFIKRVIGVPGDKVMISQGKVYLNGNPLDESEYLSPSLQTRGGTFMPEGVEKVVSENEYFVLGDNRNFSQDSREWGFVNRELIMGYSFYVYWPVSKMRVVENPYN